MALRKVIVAAIATATFAGVLFVLGLRVVLDGGGWPHLRFVQSLDQQAARIAAHRAAQRAQPSTLGDDVPGVVANDPAAPRPAADAPTAPAAVATAAPALSDVVPGAALVPAPTAMPAAWADFRGPSRDGVYRGRPIHTTWPAGGLTPLWKQPIGGGYASFVVAGNRAFTIEQRGGQEVVAAYAVTNGRELWTTAWDAAFQESMGGDGPRATPTWADGVVYALGALGELRALDGATGRTRWRTNILQDAGATNLQWGMSAAPLIVDDTVVVLPGGASGQSVLAYSRATGLRVWGALPDQASYASPMLVTIGGVRQILVVTAERVVGLSTDGASILWSHAWPAPNGINAAQPLLIGDDRIYLSAGYGMGAAVIQVSRSGDGFTTREIWRNTRMKNRFAGAVLHEGVIYGLDESILAAIDAATGELKWKSGRYGYGQLLLADGHLIVLTEDGDLALVRATPEKHDELARFQVLNGKTWNLPAMADGILLIRNLAEMAAFDLRLVR